MTIENITNLQHKLEASQRVAQDLDSLVKDVADLLNSDDGEALCDLSNELLSFDVDIINQEGLNSQITFLMDNNVNSISILRHVGLS